MEIRGAYALHAQDVKGLDQDVKTNVVEPILLLNKSQSIMGSELSFSSYFVLFQSRLMSITGCY